MLNRKPLAPNNRQAFMSEFLSSLKSAASSYFGDKSPTNKSSIRHWAGASYRQNGEGFGGGNRVQ